jgi:hypothetical protein
MNKKGQLFLVRVVFLLIIFIIIWAVWLGGFLTTYTTEYLSGHPEVVGVEAFLLANMNLWIFAFLIITLVALVMIGG